jgi:NADH-quinone oxidoreductase subunit G
MNETNRITITIDEQEVEVPEGELIVEAVKRIGKEIPIFCYHPLLKPVGMCRMCLVEVGFRQDDGTVRKLPKPQAACTLPASKGMVVWTETEQVIKDRRAVLEFLLINHPLDCPICDKGGECPLQNNTLFYGPSTSRYTEVKRHLPKAYPLSKYVTLDLERCIQCARCTRFTEEISGDGQLAMLFRGAQMQPHTYQMTDFNSRFSGNTIEICPVGALTSTTYRFRARPWDLHVGESICTGCSNGCNVWLDHRRNHLVRINARPNPDVNEDWTCDKGKFGHEHLYKPDRPGDVLIRRGDDFVKADWEQAYEAIIEAFTGAVESGGPNAIAGLGGARVTNEDNYSFQKLFRLYLRSNNLDHRIAGGWGPSPLGRLGTRTMQNSIASLENAGAIFVFGTQLAEEQPIVYLRVRKAWFRHGAKIVVAATEPTDVDAFADVVLHYRAGTEAALLAGLLRLVMESVAPEEVAGFDELRQSVAEMTPERCEATTGVGREALRRAATVLVEAEGLMTLFGALVKSHADAEQIEEALVALTIVTGNDLRENGGLNYLVPEAGSHGALDMGVLPDRLPGLAPLSEGGRFGEAWGASIPAEPGMNAEQILRACAEGKIKALFLHCCDPLTEFPDRALAERALETVEFLALLHYLETESHGYATVILPAQSWAEYDGSFTNVEGRVQQVHRVLEPVGSAKEPWRVFSELAFRLKPHTPPFGPKEIMGEIARVVPAYAHCTYEALGGRGVRIGRHFEPSPRAVHAIRVRQPAAGP